MALHGGHKKLLELLYAGGGRSVQEQFQTYLEQIAIIDSVEAGLCAPSPPTEILFSCLTVQALMYFDFQLFDDITHDWPLRYRPGVVPSGVKCGPAFFTELSHGSACYFPAENFLKDMAFFWFQVGIGINFCLWVYLKNHLLPVLWEAGGQRLKECDCATSIAS